MPVDELIAVALVAVVVFIMPVDELIAVALVAVVVFIMPVDELIAVALVAVVVVVAVVGAWQTLPVIRDKIQSFCWETRA